MLFDLAQQLVQLLQLARAQALERLHDPVLVLLGHVAEAALDQAQPRRIARGQRRAGLVGSSGAKRLRAEGRPVIFCGDVNTAPLLTTYTGGSQLTGVRAWNYDLGVEWYFKPGSSVTFNAFYKDLSDIPDHALAEHLEEKG